MSILTLDSVTYRYKNSDRPAVSGACCDFEQGVLYALIGPSGSGKSTLLSMLAGLDLPTEGDVLLEGTPIRSLDLDRYRRESIAMIFQAFQLFPLLTVQENVCYPLELIGRKPSESMPRAHELLESVGITPEEMKRFPANLSGGQQQRVAIARALAVGPEVLLLDEPLGALDLKLRKDMQTELKRIQQQAGITFIYVTHDQEEALTMSDTVVVMNEGTIQQIGTPIDIYNEPQNAFVADFIGESNIVDGVMHHDFDVSFAGGRFVCVDKGFAKDEPVDVVIRPEDIDCVPESEGMWSGTVESIVFKGVHYEILVDSGDARWMIHSTDPQTPGSRVGMKITPDDIHIMHKSDAKVWEEEK